MATIYIDSEDGVYERLIYISFDDFWEGAEELERSEAIAQIKVESILRDPVKRLELIQELRAQGYTVEYNSQYGT